MQMSITKTTIANFHHSQSKLIVLQTPSSTSLNRNLHLTPSKLTYQAPLEVPSRYPEPKRWPAKNREIYPPQEPGEERRPAWYCHHRSNVKYSPKKMWYICCLIRGMSIDEAVKQLGEVPKKGAQIAKEILLEAQEIAVREHNFEYKSNMWIGECFCTKGLVVKGIRKHARQRYATMSYFHTHFYVRLVEGKPPEHYYEAPLTGTDKLRRYFERLRDRSIKHSL